MTSPTHYECIWNTRLVQRFNGWQAAVYGPAPQRYGDILRNYVQFWPSPEPRPQVLETLQGFGPSGRGRPSDFAPRITAAGATDP